jgi:hypothetical protein
MKIDYPRDYARQYAAQAVGLLAHAFNACDRDGATYRYKQRAKFLRLAQELIELIEEGEIVALPLTAPAPTPTDVEHDRGFQKFMVRLSIAAPKPTKDVAGARKLKRTK